MYHLLLAIIYLAFISLGLPDALLGSAWPTMYQELNVPLSYAGIISMTIAAGTIVSSLMSDRVTRRFGAGMVTAVSVATTALALFGFSISGSFWMLLLWAIPYGLGAGSVDAALNNYVALHYASRHMSWLHCMWGVGISVGPYIMSYALTNGMVWNSGYRYVFLLQLGLTLLLVFSLPMWKKVGEASETEADAAPETAADDHALSFKEILSIPGALQIMIAFFCYCALEQTALLWGSSYLVLAGGLDEKTAASFASLFCIGITLGRGISGFLTLRFNDTQMIRMGMGIILAGILAILLPLGLISDMAGLALVGFGCAPIYPCIIHSTPKNFGANRSQALIGVQMASAYIGILMMPPLFGVLAAKISIRLLAPYLMAILVLMFVMHEQMLKKVNCENR